MYLKFNIVSPGGHIFNSKKVYITVYAYNKING